MLQNNSILAFYDTVTSLQHHRLKGRGENILPIRTSNIYLPPFQIIERGTAPTITSFELVDIQTETPVAVSQTGLSVTQYNDGERDFDFYVVKYTAASSISAQEGSHYIKLATSSKTYYSEVFTFCSDAVALGEMVKIQWWHNTDIKVKDGYIIYEAPYKGMAYIDSQLMNPSYEYEEEVVNRDGYIFPLQQISKKIYRFKFLANEAMLDGLRLIRLHDLVEVEYKGITLKVDDFLLTIDDWVGYGIADVEVEFITDTVVSTSAKGQGVVSGGDYDPADYDQADYLTAL